MRFSTTTSWFAISVGARAPTWRATSSCWHRGSFRSGCRAPCNGRLSCEWDRIMDTGDLDIRLRLAAQAALLDQIPRSLRAVSVEIVGKTIHFRRHFDSMPSDGDVELLSEAATNVIAHFPEPFMIDEEYLPAPR